MMRNDEDGVRARGAPGSGCGPRRPGGGPPGRRQGGFTLVELLIVVGIISLLVTMMMPMLSYALELSRRATCGGNLSNIARGLVLYETDQRSYPYLPLNGAGWGVAVGTSRELDPFAGAAAARSPSACLYLLARSRLCPQEMFVCPSAREDSKREAGEFWDFADGTAVSYAVMNPYGPEKCFDGGLAGDVPIMADSSPYFFPETGLRNEVPVVDLAEADEQGLLDGNSPNHRHAGQNATRIGGSTKWWGRADAGCDLDNIYSRADEDDGTDSHGSIPAAGPDGLAPDQGPAGRHDSYLVQ